MRLEEKINEKLKVAMKSKDKISLESLRLIKSEILLLKTKSGNSKLNEDDELNVNVDNANDNYAKAIDAESRSGAYESLQETLRKNLASRLK